MTTTKLTVSLEQAQADIAEQLRKIDSLHNIEVKQPNAIHELEHQRTIWFDYTRLMVVHHFTDRTIEQSFRKKLRSLPHHATPWARQPSSWQQQRDWIHEQLADAVTFLISLQGRLHFYVQEERSADEGDVMTFDNMYLTDKQKELLAYLISVEKGEDERSGFILTVGFGLSDIIHPSITEGVRAYEGDVKSLGVAGLLRVEQSGKDDLRFDVTGKGYAYHEWLERQKREPMAETVSTAPSRRIFVVHGHDDDALTRVRLFLHDVDLDPIVLRAEPSGGRTIIEKVEYYVTAENVAFAVVLLTPDDIGYAKDKSGDARGRARQNVILELGYCIGKLGRSHVCALTKGDIERPSDYEGVVYVSMDSGSDWRHEVAQEINAAGIAVDRGKIPVA